MMRVRRLISLSLTLLVVAALPGCTLIRPPSQSSGTARLTELLEYIPSGVADLHPADRLGFALHYIDVARIREDLGVRRITGADDRKAKLSLITGLKIQGLGIAPLNITSATAYAEWGWDIADVAQSLYVPDGGVAVLAGRFAPATIAERLARKGYTARTDGDYTLFTAVDAEWVFALKPGILLIGSDESVLQGLIVQKANTSLSLAAHPSMVALLQEELPMWGALLAASGDLPALNEQIRSSLAEFPEDQRAFLEGLLPATNTVCAYRWDLGLFSFRTTDERVSLRFLFHYAAEEHASEEANAFPDLISQTHTLTNMRRTWADMMSVQKAEARGVVLIIDATTKGNALIGESVANRDMGYLPIHCDAGQ